MAAIVYPSALPMPNVTRVQPAERRLVSELTSGPVQFRGVQRDFLAQQYVEWSVLTPTQAEALDTWWRYVLLAGGAWFAASWPLPSGWGPAVRRFLEPPDWQYLTNGLWRVSAQTQVRGRGMFPISYVPEYGLAELFNPSALFFTTNLPLSNGNMTGIVPGSNFTFYGAFLRDRTGAEDYTTDDKRYFEVHIDGPHELGAGAGFYPLPTSVGFSANPYSPGNDAYVAASYNHGGSTIGIVRDGAATGDGEYATAVGNVIGVAINGENGNLFFSRDGEWLGVQDPATDANPAATLPSLASMCGYVGLYDETGGIPSGLTVRLGADIAHQIPAGYKPWNQTN